MALSQLGHYPFLLALILVSGLSGSFLYGYNISVMTSLSKVLSEASLEASAETAFPAGDWRVSPPWFLTVSVFAFGGFTGSLAAGFLLAHVGRKTCIMLNSSLAIVASALMACSESVMSSEMFCVGRFLFGVTAGIGVAAHTLYITECAPEHLRGAAGVSVAAFTCMGRVCGQLLGMRVLLGIEDFWSVVVGVVVFTASLQFVLLPFLPESPSFLLHDRGDRRACEKALKVLWGDGDHSRVVEDMLREKAAVAAAGRGSVTGLLLDRRLHWQLLALLVTFLSLPLSGVAAVYFYSSEVFGAAGVEEGFFPHLAIGMTLCEWICSLIAFVTIERRGSRVLLMEGYSVMSVTLLLFIVTLSLQWCFSWMRFVSMALVLLFIGGCAIGPGAVTGPLPGLIFPHAFRSTAFALGSCLHWAAMLMVGATFPFVMEVVGQYVFLVFLCVCVGCGLFVKFQLPDIKGHTLAEVTAGFKVNSMSGEPAAAPGNAAKDGVILEARL